MRAAAGLAAGGPRARPQVLLHDHHQQVGRGQQRPLRLEPLLPSAAM